MGAVVALSELFEARRVWRGRTAPLPTGAEPTGWPALDAVLPAQGWPEASVTEILLPADGVGELRLVMPTLARLSHGVRPVALVTPPYFPCAMGWRQRGVALRNLHVVQAPEGEVLWAMEQCLRSGSCSAALAWPRQADDRALRRLQIAADTGRALAFVFRDSKHLGQASPAPLRLALETAPTPGIRVHKCRGGQPPAAPVAWPDRVH